MSYVAVFFLGFLTGTAATVFAIALAQAAGD